MATFTNPIENEELTRHFVVVHPLDDVPEEKVDTESLGPMAMTASVRISLLSLRAYLVLMMGLVLYRVVILAGGLGHNSGCGLAGGAGGFAGQPALDQGHSSAARTSPAEIGFCSMYPTIRFISSQLRTQWSNDSSCQND